MPSQNRAFYAILGVLPFILCLGGIAALLSGPYTGLSFSHEVDGCHLSSVTDSSPGAALKQYIGHRVVSLNDFTLEGHDLVEDFDYIPDRDSLAHWWRAQGYFSVTVKPGEPLTVVIESDNGFEKVDIIPETMPAERIFSAAGMMFFIGLFSLFVGLCVVLRKPGDERAQRFFFMVFSVALIFVTFGSYTSRDIAFAFSVFTLFRIINVFAFSYFPVLFLHFCLVFPRKKQIAGKRNFITILYLIPLAVSIIYQPRLSYLSLNLLLLSGLLLGVASIVNSYFTSKSKLEKYQIRWIIWGVGIFVAIFHVTTILPVIFNGHRLFGDRVPSLFFIFIPLSMAFAITKYHILDIDSIFDTTLVYFLTIGTVSILDFGIMAGITHIRFSTFTPGEPFAALLALWLAVLAYVPVRNSIHSLIRRLFKRDNYDPQETTMRLGTSLLKAHDVDSSVAIAIDALESTFYPLGIQAYIISDDNTCIKSLSRGMADECGFTDMCSSVRRYDRPQPVYQLSENIDTFPVSCREGVFVPLHAAERPIGYFLLWNKKSGMLYNSGDLRFLNTVANQTALAIESIRSKEEIAMQERERLKERERISREIHDGIGSTFSNSIMLAELAGRDREHGNAGVNRLAQLTVLLEKGLGDLRDFIWTVEPNEDTRIGSLLTLIGERSTQILGERYKIKFETSIDDGDVSLTPMIRLNTIRILQESLTNIVKHSQATEVTLKIDVETSLFSMAIVDNGCGFDSENVKSAGYGLRNIRKRCEEMNAECTIISEISRGTQIRVEFPVQRTASEPLS